MSLRSRIRACLAIIAVNSLLFLAFYSWNLSRMRAGINEVRAAAEQTRSLSTELAGCIGRLELATERYIATGDAAIGRSASALSQRCQAQFTSTRLPMVPIDRLEADRFRIAELAETARRIAVSGALASPELLNQYNSERIAVARLPGEVPLIYVEQISDRASQAMRALKMMGFWGGLSMATLLGLYLVMIRWMGTSWNATLRRLNQLCARIISGNDEVRLEIQHLSEKGSGNDDLGVAYEAIGRTLDELSVLRRSLEDKVNERTKELRDAQQQLIQSGKLAALGTLAAGVAHELNNPLTIILGLAEEAKLDKTIKPQVQRMARIIDQLKRLARRSDDSEHVPTGLRALVHSSVVLLGGKLRHASVDLEVRIDPDLYVLCDPVKLESVLTNLIQNAVDALEATDRLRRFVRVETSFRPSKALVIRVADNGPGIPAAIRAKIFEPFFTTKDVNRGTGLGLSLCHQIVEELGGRMWLETSADGSEGSVFSIELPASRVVSSDALAA